MYKSKLQEFCQRWRWPFPEYNTMKDGPQHAPRFTATVNVNGNTFFTPGHHKSAKEAQNDAAHIALYHLSSLSAQVANSSAVNYPTHSVNYSGYQVPQAACHMANTQYPVADGGPMIPISPSPSELPIPTFRTPVLAPKTESSTSNLNNVVTAQQNFRNIVQSPAVSGDALQVQKGKLHIYKNLLQQYAQKKAIALPVYHTNTEGPGHALRFKSKVSVDGQSYETQESFTTLREAEHAVAKAACEALSLDVVQGDDVSYKNLLQELALRRGLDDPSYKTTTFGLSHKPSFVSQVELGELSFHGGEAKTKKQAEMNAAKVAYHALIGGSQPAVSSIPSSVCPGTPQPKPSSVEQSAIVGTLRVEERASTRKQTDFSNEETELQAKRAKTSAENVNAINADVPGSSHAILQPSNPAPVHGEVGEAKSVEPLVIQPPASTSTSSRTILVPQKTTLVTPECSLSTMLPISDDQWSAYKVEMKQDPGTTA